MTDTPHTPHPLRHQRAHFRERLPSGAKLVARPSRWGNPFRIEAMGEGADGDRRYQIGRTMSRDADGQVTTYTIADGLTIAEARAEATRQFRDWLRHAPDGVELARAAREQLAGRVLVCYCPLNQPCHADVLCEVANGGTP